MSPPSQCRQRRPCLHRLVDRSDDEVLEHLGVVGIDHRRVDLHLQQLLGSRHDRGDRRWPCPRTAGGSSCWATAAALASSGPASSAGACPVGDSCGYPRRSDQTGLVAPRPLPLATRLNRSRPLRRPRHPAPARGRWGLSRGGLFELFGGYVDRRRCRRRQWTRGRPGHEADRDGPARQVAGAGAALAAGSSCSCTRWNSWGTWRMIVESSVPPGTTSRNSAHRRAPSTSRRLPKRLGHISCSCENWSGGSPAFDCGAGSGSEAAGAGRLSSRSAPTTGFGSAEGISSAGRSTGRGDHPAGAGPGYATSPRALSSRPMRATSASGSR